MENASTISSQSKALENVGLASCPKRDRNWNKLEVGSGSVQPPALVGMVEPSTLPSTEKLSFVMPARYFDAFLLPRRCT